MGISPLMPAHPQFGDQELDALVAYIRSFPKCKKEKGVEKPAEEPAPESRLPAGKAIPTREAFAVLKETEAELVSEEEPTS